MEIKKCETRTPYICKVGGHSYVRTVIDWTGDREQTIAWHLNESEVDGAVYLTHEELEKLFCETIRVVTTDSVEKSADKCVTNFNKKYMDNYEIKWNIPNPENIRLKFIVPIDGVKRWWEFWERNKSKIITVEVNDVNKDETRTEDNFVPVSADKCIKTRNNSYSDFESAVRPLMKYLGEKTHPHCSAVVRCDCAELVEGKETVVTKDYIVD